MGDVVAFLSEISNDQGESYPCDSFGNDVNRNQKRRRGDYRTSFFFHKTQVEKSPGSLSSTSSVSDESEIEIDDTWCK